MKRVAANKEEKKWMDFISKLPCCVCGAYTKIEIHHITDANGRLGHLFTLPLCIPCHRGERGFSGIDRDSWDKALERQLQYHRTICSVYNFRIPPILRKPQVQRYD